jgi:sugar lactone lactonase YvrE
MKPVYSWILCAGLGMTGLACNAESGGGQLAEARKVGVDVGNPFDATPTPNADAIFFTGMSLETGGILYKVGTAAGSEPTMIASGFVAPTSLVMSTKGDVVYVADLGLQGETAEVGEKPAGAVYSVPAGGGAPTLLAPTDGYGPRSLDLVAESKTGDVLYFTGNNPESGAAGVYRMPLPAGALETVYEGPALREPSGIAVAGDGEVYVIDTISTDVGAALVKVGDGEVTILTPGLRVGYPAGLALTVDEGFVLVSGIKAEAGSAQVYRIDLGDPSLENAEVVDMGIAENTESAGLHRAHTVDNYAWADANAKGSVYLLGTKTKPLQ